MTGRLAARASACATRQECRRHHFAAVDQRRDRHHRLQRRDVEPLTEGDRHRVELAPVLGHQRLGALRQLGAQPIELTHLPQERLVTLDAHHQRQSRGADVGGMGEHFRHGQNAMGGVKIVDGEVSVAQAFAGVDARIERDLARVERHRQRQRLEGRTHLVDADVEAVDPRWVLDEVGGIVRIEIRQRFQCDDFAGGDVEDRPGGRLGLETRQAGDEFVAQGVGRLEVERQLDRFQRRRDRERNPGRADR